MVSEIASIETVTDAPVLTARAWSKQQQAIFGWFQDCRGHLVVRARAGTGKTASIVEGVTHAPEARILLAAFNKRIQEELAARLTNPAAEAKTLHGVGFAVVKTFWEGVSVACGSTRVQTLVDEVCDWTAPDAIKRLVGILVTKAREIAPHATAVGQLTDLALNFECAPSEEWEDAGWGLDYVEQRTLDAMVVAAATKPADGIDFADMLFLPVRNRWLMPRYDLVVVDECLPGWTPVMLGDGSSMTIQQIVESDIDVVVRAFDTATGEEKNCRVAARHKILNQKPLVKISTRHDLTEKSGRGRNCVVCTIDHKVWTKNRGWVEAGQLQVGDEVQVETAALKAQHGKTTTAGRKRLALSTTGDRSRGGNRSGTREQFNAIKGGNGRGPTLSERTLAAALGDGWIVNYAIPTGKNQMSGEGWPSNDKVDIANPERKISVEVDGQSHNREHQKALDAKKTARLEGMGWRIYRVSNRRAIQNAAEEACRIAGDCPRPAFVLSVDLVEIRDSYVYDIAVEECHNFYANGILVHNCQDMTSTQLELARGVCRGRIAVVGDDRQAIYGFRGADSASLDRLKAELQAIELGLTVSYRCPRVVVEEAKRLVPDFEASADAIEGEIRSVGTLEAAIGMAGSGDFIVSRTNAPLAKVAMALLRAHKRVRIQGRDIGQGLMALARTLMVGKAAHSLPAFLERVVRWEAREVERAYKADRPERAESVRDKGETLRALSEGAAGPHDLVARLTSLFSDTGAADVVCSSIHKAKGLEARRVFVLRPTLYPKRPKDVAYTAARTREEANLHYVAITRAQETLVYVEQK